MTAADRPYGLLRLPLGLVSLLRDLAVGAVLCATPVTSLIALGWLTRRMAGSDVRPGWLLGPRHGGWLGFLAGGLAANIRTGVLAAAGLAAWTLPFALAWLGAWWAGWENSFNKGYEQAAVGPSVWLAATLLALPVLAHLPIGLAHFAATGRFGAFFELRTIRRAAAASGWRLPALAVLSAVLAVGLFGMRALPVFVEQIVPGFAGMAPETQAQIAGRFDLAAAALSFAGLLLVRRAAGAAYAFAHLRPKPPRRVVTAVWTILACVLWLSLPVLVVFGQFVNYDPWLWLTHPLFLLPWPG